MNGSHISGGDEGPSDDEKTRPSLSRLWPPDGWMEGIFGWNTFFSCNVFLQALKRKSILQYCTYTHCIMSAVSSVLRITCRHGACQESAIATTAATRRNLRRTLPRRIRPLSTRPMAAAIAAHANRARNNHHDGGNHWYNVESAATAAMLFLAAAAAASIPFGPTTQTEPRRSPSINPRAATIGRFNSINEQGLSHKYNVDWKVVLGEGAYGSVHPARLAATGEKVRV